MNTQQVDNHKNTIINLIKDKSLTIKEKWEKINLLEYVESNEIYKAEIDAQNLELQHNQEVLLLQTAKLRKLFNSIPLPVIQLDSALNIIKYNDEANQLLKIESSFTYKKFLPLILNNENLPEFFKAIDLASIQPKSKITLRLFEELEEKTIEFNIVLFPDEDGLSYLITLIDLTEQIEKSKELQTTTTKLYEKESEKIENYQKTIVSLVELIEQRDFYTGGHSFRVAEYAVQIALKLGFNSKDVFMLRQIGLLHDIGKIGIPDSILLKPGKLTIQEHNIIKSHVEVGYNIISRIPMFKEFSEIILSHHERYDGTGYPNGLKGDDIPILAQVLSIADTFDAMTTTRIYNSKKTIEHAINEIKNESGKLFKPEIVDIAIKVFESADIEQHKTQLPTTSIDKERFAYYFKDVLTDLSNEEYLKVLFEKNKEDYKCLNLILVHNFSQYNKKFGWGKGNELLIKIANELKENYPAIELFRFHGVNFIILNNTHIELNIENLNKSFSEYGLEIELKHYDVENFETAKELLESLNE